MKNLRYKENQLTLHRLVLRKLRQWTKIDYISADEAKGLSKKYLDKRWTATRPVRTLLFLATSIFLIGGISLISLLIEESSPFILFIIAIIILFIYESFVGKRYYQAGMDKAFILVGASLVIISILLMFEEQRNDSPVQFLISAAILWLFAIRYHNYILYYGSFILLQIYFFAIIKVDLPFSAFLMVSLISTLCFVLYFMRRRKTLTAYALRWNETLEIFFLLLLLSFLNPKLQESLYKIFSDKINGDPMPFFNDSGLFLMIFLIGIYAVIMLILGISRKVRAYLIIAVCAIFVGLITCWYYFWQDWNLHMINTFGGLGIISIGLFLNSYLKDPKWKLTSKKIAHQNDLTHIFDNFKKITKRSGLNE